ncbi:hypothetical protein [Acidocella aminolytica]|uniref:Uncharacterized protein n=1 Tax=Acidocella aminolytica 101 = DSM 11237 TaxID=1120923 RepID=A0A0D6PI92_9PROT|nr:hypothetical protein [Acidocella aminolytica]GAN80923.1 hypothetical protein Aam_062_018 [Acidocella aminolytica 101 = DSM 11237]
MHHDDLGANIDCGLHIIRLDDAIARFHDPALRIDEGFQWTYQISRLKARFDLALGASQRVRNSNLSFLKLN